MTARTKNGWSIAGLIMLTILLLYQCYKGTKELYTLQYGRTVEAKVINNDDVCRYKNKSILLLVEGRTYRMELYGPGCRDYRFRLNSIIQVKKSDRDNIFVLPDNFIEFRMSLFLLLTALMPLILIKLIKHRKKLAKNNG